MEAEIREIVNRETSAWDSQNVERLLSIFHPDFVWVWPATSNDHDPMTWEMVLGKFNHHRWADFYQRFFEAHTLIHNKRVIRKVEISAEGDAAFAVVDIDTFWKNKAGINVHWFGRVCKGYAKTGDEWKITMHTGVLQY